MRLMTYNIKLGLQLGLAPVVELLRAERPDVVALQEVGSNWREGPPGDTAAHLAARAGLDHIEFVPTLRSGAGVRYGHALLSRWPLRPVVRRHLPVREDEPRTALVADVVAPEGAWRVVSTHLSHVEPDRRIQGPEFCRLVEEARSELPSERPLVVAGDLNEPRSEAAPWMRELLAEFDQAGRIDPSPTFENPVPDARIDYLLVDGGRWSSAHVPDRPDVSDHLPVVGEVQEL